MATYENITAQPLAANKAGGPGGNLLKEQCTRTPEKLTKNILWEN